MHSIAKQIDGACREVGFFTLEGHGLPPGTLPTLDRLAREFFALDEERKAAIAMPLAGTAWRGWFPFGGELTSGLADRKEGLYFGTELPRSDPRVGRGLALHGPNLFPAEPKGLRDAVLDYIDRLTAIGQRVLSLMAIGLGLPTDWFATNLTADPLRLMRIFRYPPQAPGASGWGVGEHTDYGLLTLLAQDSAGGLEVHTDDGWVQVDPEPDTLVCNLGDMLERLTGGAYRSTLHRVRSPSRGNDRLSFPFFLDPSWDARVERLPIVPRPAGDDAAKRWDHASVHGFEGTYGDYITAKVAKVFPELGAIGQK